MEFLENRLEANKVSLIQELLTVLAGTSAFLSRYGISRPPTLSAKNLNVASSMDPIELRGIIDRAAKILHVHMEIEKHGLDFDDSVSLTRFALKELKLMISDDIYKLIRRRDIVEIYSQDHVQIFRSFNFFRICNYNLDDILLNKWFELYERSPAITETIMTQVMDHLGSARNISKFDVPNHPMKERFADPQGTFLTKFKYLASVFSGPEQRAGFLTTLRGRPMTMPVNHLSFLPA